ncbi:MAG: hypothetical protein ABFD07_02900 [Methanobacterium sp.]
MTEIKRKRAKIGTTISPDIKSKAEEYGNGPGYSGLSNFIEIALTYYMGALDRENEIKFEECKKELERLRTENERNSSIILKLLTRYPELIQEVNELQKQNHSITSTKIRLD